MEHNTPQGLGYLRSSRNPVGSTIVQILNAQFMNECYLILAVSTNTIHVCILATILQYNLVKYLSFS